MATLKEMADAIALKRGGTAVSAGSGAARAIGQATATSPQPEPDKPKTLAEMAADISVRRGQSTGGSGGGMSKGLDREVVELAIMNAAHNYKIEESSPVQHSYTAIPVILKEEAYRHLCIAFKGVSDEHRMQLLIKALK